MTPRERYLQSLLFGKPDKITFLPGGPRESTLARWRREGLPEKANWMNALCREIGIPREHSKCNVQPGVNFRMIPQFEEKVIEHKDGHYIVQD